MCKSITEGGQRCASYARKRFNRVSPTDPEWDTVAAEYASTPEGEQRLNQEAADAADEGDHETAARLNSAIRRGLAMRQANRAAAAEIARRQQERHTLTEARERFNKTAPTDPDWDTVAAEYAATPEGNQHLTREAVDAADEGDHESAARLNAAIRRGRAIRQAQQQPGAAASGASAEAFPADSPAAQVNAFRGKPVHKWTSAERGETALIASDGSYVLVTPDNEDTGHWFVDINRADGSYEDGGCFDSRGTAMREAERSLYR